MQKTSSWSAVYSMALCVSLLIASEFLPVSLLTPMAQGLNATSGQTGQAIAMSGFFAMAAALTTSTLIGKIDRKYVLVSMTSCMMASLIITALAPNFTVLIIARALLGICIGGFWSLATSTIMRLVPVQHVTKALGAMYMGQALATAFAAPLGSYLEVFIGWRGVFALLIPIVAFNLLWQLKALPALPSEKSLSPKTFLVLLKRPFFHRAMLCMALSFSGAFMMFTYLRPYLEHIAGYNIIHITFCFLTLGCASFLGGPLGSLLSKNYNTSIIKSVPAIMGLVTLGLLLLPHSFIIIFLLLAMWGSMSTLLSMSWMSWMAHNITDTPEAAGSLMVAVIQGSILCGSIFGGEILERTNLTITFSVSILLSLLALLFIGSGKKILPSS